MPGISLPTPFRLGVRVSPLDPSYKTVHHFANRGVVLIMILDQHWYPHPNLLKQIWDFVLALAKNVNQDTLAAFASNVAHIYGPRSEKK